MMLEATGRSLGPASRRVHPLKAWRMTRTVPSGPAGKGRPTGDGHRRSANALTMSFACRLYSRFVGREVHPHTWFGWERYPDEQGHRKPDTDNMHGLFLFTNGAIRPDHFYEVEEWRRELAERRMQEIAAPLAGAGDEAAGEAVNPGAGAHVRGVRPSPSPGGEAGG